MGYTTDFTGHFRLNRPLTEEQARYLHAFASTRRMKRDAGKVKSLADPVREAVGLPVGQEGCYFVGGSGFMGQERDDSIQDYNRPPGGQPGLWCKWVPTEDRRGIEWSGAEKFYDYVRWLEYLIEHFLAPWGYMLNGHVTWAGEDPDDVGLIRVSENRVEAISGPVRLDPLTEERK
jgi:hypothetical protein